MSNFYESNLNEGNELSMATSPFFTDRVFESHEELMQWVQNTAFSLGYIIVTRRLKAKENGVVSYITLICSYLKQYDGWALRVICDQHNHPPTQHMEGHAYARRLKENEKKLLVDLTSKNVIPRDILSTLKEQDENNVFTLTTIDNARQKLCSSQNVGECIPLDSIDVFWRKLDLSLSTSMENEDICYDGELEMFKGNFTKQSKTGKKSLLRKLRDIFQLSKTLIKEPTIQKNTRGRPTLKKQQQKRVNSISQTPRRRSHSTTSKFVGLDLVELNKELARYSSYVAEIPDLNQEPSEKVSDFIDLNQMPKSCDTHPLMKKIPNMFHPYITYVQDVRGEGNCRFRAIPVCLAYGEDQWLYV
ncbi:hypothetical protein PVK06_001057 [Gossypium arboreum]|uniref:Protein FAR1-RELATED SEQUENCE n=1 Tax=Gossypium arboreum TaxID=29729 RepID=A0ABR0R122_GOSAR|nr:hypothetical protein PVK06_001057 [Gossypium arboreum]